MFFDLIYAFPPLHRVITRFIRVIHVAPKCVSLGFWIARINRAMTMRVCDARPYDQKMG